MPANQGLGFDDDQGLFPIAEARPEDETDTGRVVQSSRLDLSLLIEGQLLSQEQDLSALRSEGIETWAVRIAHGQSVWKVFCTSRGWLLGFSSAAKPNK